MLAPRTAEILTKVGAKQAGLNGRPVGARPADAPPADPTRSPQKLRIGLALGAGAARGWSHIGVLQELIAQRIVPDIVAGTSIGAIVGGYYAAGRLNALTGFALALTKRRVLGLMDVSLSGLSLFAGSRLRKSLEEELLDLSIERLPKCFAAVATEVTTGHEVWLRRGSLIEAMRASYALPAILQPVRIDGRWLFDGALVNPVPVTVCRALGADMVIAVNLIGDNAFRSTVIRDGTGSDRPLEWLDQQSRNATGSKWYRNSAPGIASAVMDAFNIAQDRISRSRLAGDPPDVLINARNAHIGVFDFHRAEELIAIGRDAARRALNDITDQMAHMPRPVANGGPV